MKQPYANFLNKSNLLHHLRCQAAFFKLSISQQLVYRFNFVIDAMVQPSVTAIMEIALWGAIVNHLPGGTLMGFGAASYITYTVWAVFFARVSANWMYEFRMVNEISSGEINALLLRPVTFYEAYLSQYLAYKWFTLVFSMLAPLAVCVVLQLPVHYSRIPVAMIMIGYYMFFCFTLSFCVATLAFKMTRVQSITMAKNLSLTIMTGEYYPLDLLPETIKQVFLNLPFSAGVFLPAAFVAGRIPSHMFLDGFRTISLGMLVTVPLAIWMWRRGKLHYTGTGA